MLTGWRQWLNKAGIYFPLLIMKQRLMNRRQLRQYKTSHPPLASGKYGCNCCGQSFAAMVAWEPMPAFKNALYQNKVLAGYGPHTICPGCLSTSRERLLVAAIEHLLKPKGLEILHFAPEEKLFPRLAANNHVTAVDIMPELYRHIAPGIVKADITALPFDNNRYDMVWCNHVLEHIPHDAMAMAEIYRVLKPGGRAILQVPLGMALTQTLEDNTASSPAKRSALFGQNDHVRIYCLADYLHRVKQAGFDVQLIPQASFVPAHVAVQPGEDLILAHKPSSTNPL